jgi:hypothetical protein
MKKKTPLLAAVQYRLRHAGRLATAGRRRLPDFLILGAAKSGTTSLYNYLIQHPCVEPCFRKEVHYFDRNFNKGVRWYRSFFPRKDLHKAGCSRVVSGESSPYYLFHPLAAERIARVAPEARFFVLLRDPADRAVSHYNHRVRAGQEKLPIEEAFAAEEERLRGEAEKLGDGVTRFSFNHYYYSYLSRGRYARQLESWFSRFPRGQFLVIDSDDLFRDPDTVYRSAIGHLGLAYTGPARYAPFNSADKTTYTALPPALRARLSDAFAEDNERLFDLLGKRFPWQPHTA